MEVGVEVGGGVQGAWSYTLSLLVSFHTSVERPKWKKTGESEAKEQKRTEERNRGS